MRHVIEALRNVCGDEAVLCTMRDSSPTNVTRCTSGRLPQSLYCHARSAEEVQQVVSGTGAACWVMLDSFVTWSVRSMMHARLFKPANVFDVCGVAACVVVALLSMRPLDAQGPDPLEILIVQGDVHLIAGAGGNIAVQTGPDGLVLVDSGAAGSSEQVLSAIKRLSDQPIRYIINTSAHPEHVGGNTTIAAAGRSLAAGGFNTVGAGAIVVANEAVLTRMSAPTGQVSPVPCVGVAG